MIIDVVEVERDEKASGAVDKIDEEDFQDCREDKYVMLDKSYQDVTNIYDGPLQVGFKNPKNNKIKNKNIKLD
jgi:hypothetical protein